MCMGCCGSVLTPVYLQRWSIREKTFHKKEGKFATIKLSAVKAFAPNSAKAYCVPKSGPPLE